VVRSEIVMMALSRKNKKRLCKRRAIAVITTLVSLAFFSTNAIASSSSAGTISPLLDFKHAPYLLPLQ
jgi:hypothetical protein